MERPMQSARLTPGPGFAPLNSLLYFSQRVVTIPACRRSIVRLLSLAVRVRQRALRRGTLPVDEQALHTTLGKDGYVPLGNLVNRQQCAAIHRYLRDKALSDRHNAKVRFTIGDVPKEVRLGDYSLPDIVNCPHILELANSPALLRLAERYIGCTPTISALMLRWSFPRRSGSSELQAYHRDPDDWRFLKVLVYLSDVDLAGGPHKYVLGTHATKSSARVQSYSDESIRKRYGDGNVAVIVGKCGAGFAVDTAGIHKGEAPTGHRRLLLQIQYSLLPRYDYRYEPVPYEGGFPLKRYVNRLIVAQ
jgi:hypothetical protein